MKIIEVPNDLLRVPCEPVVQFDENLQELAERLAHAVRQVNGVGLAAPQLGVSLRVFVWDSGDCPECVVNPVLLSRTGRQCHLERCLSVPGAARVIDRPKRIKVRYQDLTGQRVTTRLLGYPAAVWCHEMDHLDGKLFTDYSESSDLPWREYDVFPA